MIASRTTTAENLTRGAESHAPAVQHAIDTFQAECPILEKSILRNLQGIEPPQQRFAARFLWQHPMPTVAESRMMLAHNANQPGGPRIMLRMIQDPQAATDSQRAEIVLALYHIIGIPAVRDAIASALQRNIAQYSQTVWAAIDVLARSSDKASACHIFFAAIVDPRCSEQNCHQLWDAIGKIARDPDAFKVLVDFIATSECHDPTHCTKLLEVILNSASADGIAYAINRHLPLFSDRLSLQYLVIAELLRIHATLPQVITYLCELYDAQRNDSWLRSDLEAQLAARVHLPEVSAVLIKRLRDTATLSPHERAYYYGLLKTRHDLREVRALAFDVFSDANSPTTLRRDIVGNLLNYATEADVYSFFIDQLKCDPTSPYKHHMQTGLETAATCAQGRVALVAWLASIARRSFCFTQSLPYLVLEQHGHENEVCSYYVELLTHPSRVWIYSVSRLDLLDRLKAAAVHDSARATIASAFLKQPFSTYWGWTAFTLLSTHAHKQDVYDVYCRLQMQYGELPVEQLIFDIDLAHVPLRNTPRPAADDNIDHMDLVDSGTSAHLFFAALFAVEDYQRRAQTMLDADIVLAIKNCATGHTLDAKYATIRELARGRYLPHAIEADLAPLRYIQLATIKHCAPFTCTICCEEKAPFEAVSLACCAKNNSVAICYGCAARAALSTDTPKLQDKCPCECGAPLAIQDIASVVGNVSQGETIARRRASAWLANLPDWKACDAPDCIGGNCSTAASGKILQCLICTQPMNLPPNTEVIHRLLRGIGPRGDQNADITREAACCGRPTEKNEGCNHMTCKCGKDWHFDDGLGNNSGYYRSKRTDASQNYCPAGKSELRRIGFYHDIPPGKLTDALHDEVQRRASEWLTRQSYSYI